MSALWREPTLRSRHVRRRVSQAHGVAAVGLGFHFLYLRDGPLLRDAIDDVAGAVDMHPGGVDLDRGFPSFAGNRWESDWRS